MKHDEKMNCIQGLPGRIEERKRQYESLTANGELYDAFELTKEIGQPNRRYQS